MGSLQLVIFSLIFSLGVSASGLRCADALDQTVYSVPGYMVRDNSSGRLAVIYNQQTVPTRLAEMVVAEFERLQNLVSGVLVSPVRALIKLSPINSAANNEQTENSVLNIPLEFKFKIADSPRVIDVDNVTRFGRTVRLHEFSHSFFDASLARDLPAYSLLLQSIQHALKQEHFFERYDRVKLFVEGNMFRPAKMNPSDPNFERATALVNKMYLHAQSEFNIAKELREKVEQTLGEEPRLKITRITSIHELFADFLASVEMDSTSVTRELQELAEFPKTHPFSMGRAFDREIKHENWSHTEAHGALAPSRSFLGPYMTKAQTFEEKRALIKKVYAVLRNQIQDILEMKQIPKNFQKDLNKKIIEELQEALR